MGAAFVLPSAPKPHGAALDCVVVPEMTEGPFFVDERLERSDLTAGTSEPFVTKGLPLLLRIGVFQIKGVACAPLVAARSTYGTRAPKACIRRAKREDSREGTVGEKYLRGYQRTDRMAP